MLGGVVEAQDTPYKRANVPALTELTFEFTVGLTVSACLRLLLIAL